MRGGEGEVKFEEWLEGVTELRAVENMGEGGVKKEWSTSYLYRRPLIRVV